MKHNLLYCGCDSIQVVWLVIIKITNVASSIYSRPTCWSNVGIFNTEGQ